MRLTITPDASYAIAPPDVATVTIADSVAEVSVTATDDSASETGPDTATLTFTRTTGGNLAAALAVDLTIEGTATNGLDYFGIALQVPIPAGQTSVTRTITPRRDNSIEGDETMIVTINPNPAYAVGTPETAILTIADSVPAVSVGVDSRGRVECRHPARDALVAAAGPNWRRLIGPFRVHIWQRPGSRSPVVSPRSSGMTIITSSRSRRHFLASVAAGGAGLLFAPGVFAEQLILTPRQTEGPFYPTKLPLDTDNDLIIVNGAITPAVGVVTHLGGRVLDERGAPLRNAVVEIWQVDGHGAYLHPKSDNAAKRDAHFQGFGRFLTGSDGQYYFRTVKPVAYPGRTPHIHVTVKQNGRERLTTQCYVKGDSGNERDSILRGIRDPKARESVIVDFAPVPQSPIGELQARFDIVLGATPSV